MVIFAFGIIIALLVISVLLNIYLLYPLVIGIIILIFISTKKGCELSDIFFGIKANLKKSMNIIVILLLIGALTGIWRASGTVAYIITFGMSFLNPPLLCSICFFTLLLIVLYFGHSIRHCRNPGVVLIIMAKSGGINVGLTAGAILAGSYFGDRCSPLSSSANLVAILTETNVYTNIKNMFATAAVPFLLSIVIYTFFSINNPLAYTENGILQKLTDSFNLNPATILPAILILILAFFRVDIRISILLSILTAAVCTVFCNTPAFLRFLLFYFPVIQPPVAVNWLRQSTVAVFCICLKPHLL